jgi:hypothetical protein
MPETLLTPSSIKLFGRVLRDLTFNYDLTETVSIGSNNFLQQQLSSNLNPIIVVGTTTTGAGNQYVTAVNTLGGLESGMTVTAQTAGGAPVFAQGTTISQLGGVPGPGLSFTLSINAAQTFTGNITATPLTPQFARIYAFSFEGALYGMPRPSIFLVHGIGTVVDMTQQNTGYRSTLDQSGVLAREWEFSAQKNNDMRYWEYEKGDFSIRLDSEAGPFEQILLAAALRAGADMADRAGIRSGASLSGASLSGASVSGASLSGASLSGASLSGASLRR